MLEECEDVICQHFLTDPKTNERILKATLREFAIVDSSTPHQFTTLALV